MAKFTTVGVEDFLAWIQRVEDCPKRVIPLLLEAGADVAQRAMEATTSWDDDTGQLRGSLYRTPVMGKRSSSYIDIYPSGTTPDGERLEEIGFVLEYGRGAASYTREDKTYVITEMDPRPWMRPAIEDNPDIVNRMQEVWKRELGRI